MDLLVNAFLVTFLLTAAFTPLTIYLAKKFSLVDDPNKRPHPAHLHLRVIPRAGGLPIYLGILIAILIFIPLSQTIIGMLLATLLLLVIGLIDDYLTDFSPFPRLLIHFLAAFIVVISGVGIHFITNPFGGIISFQDWVINFYFFGMRSLYIVADTLTLFWIVWMMHMINWSKGVDGQMAGIVTVAALTLATFSFSLFSKGDANQFIIALLAVITAGAAASFMLFNWYPSRILPGQTASTILGFFLAVLSILSGAKLAVALLVLLIPSIDFFYTFFRRILSGKSPFYGDQKHLHHLLLKRGLSHRQISLFYIFSCAILGLLAINLSSQGKLFTVLGVGVVILGSILWLHLFSKEEES